ncbi:hypothetical protein ACFPOU_07610 [Massilia jejuensis]|uniref:Uncharacterized protein n=1 Tax=Massilia jejuensis TaxID=648894 RepID=A0ABW0PEB8_9BURK
MSMVVPPYRAQYVRFADAVMRYLEVQDPRAPDHVFGGAFFFLTHHRSAGAPEGNAGPWNSSSSASAGTATVAISRCPVKRIGGITVGKWLSEVLGVGRTADE